MEAVEAIERSQGLPPDKRWEYLRTVTRDHSRKAMTHPPPMIPGLPSDPEGDGILQDWFSNALIQMHEPKLSAATPGEAYRFLWMRSFDRPVVVRITRANSGYTITHKELDEAGGFDGGKLIVDEARELDAEQWNEFVRVHARTLWSKAPRGGKEGADGAEWVVEAVRDGRYHLVVRWSPTDDAMERDFTAACLGLLDLAKARPHSNVY